MPLKAIKKIRFFKNDKVRIKAVCAVDETCSWSLYASVITDTRSFIIRTLNEAYNETCGTDFLTKHITSKWLCAKYLNQWRGNPSWSFAGFKQQVRDDLKVDVTRWKYYRAKKLAQKKIGGLVKDQ